MTTTKSRYRAVNLLYLIVLLLLISNAVLMWIPHFVRLIITQLLFVFLPAYLYLRQTRQPILERVRWRWPSWRIAGLSLLIGMGLYPLSALSAGVLQQLLGYVHLPAPADAIPDTALMGVLAVVAYAVMAPLCEEFLFRGVIQPVYERLGPGWGVLFVGFLFIAFHLSLLQGLSIILLALALGFVNYRTGSLQASILTHFGANFLAALVLTNDVFSTGAQAVLFSTPVLIAGSLVALMAFIVFTRVTRGCAHPVPDPQPDERPFALAALWPLLIAGALFLLMIGFEYVVARSPDLVAEPLSLEPAEWDGTASWQYEIRNPADAVVGDGDCLIAREGPLINLECTSVVIAYEVRIGSSFWSSAGGERNDQFTWHAADGKLVSGQTIMDLADGNYRAEIRWTIDDSDIEVLTSVVGEEDRLFRMPWDETPRAEDGALPIVTDLAAPWQLTAVSLEAGEIGQTMRFNPYTWRPETEDTGPATARWLVKIVGREEISTPAGTFDAWRVTFGQHHEIWLVDDTMPTTPVRFFNGIETWSLK
jgi:membrane protease YdiL (CAAX protease family)